MSECFHCTDVTFLSMEWDVCFSTVENPLKDLNVLKKWVSYLQNIPMQTNIKRSNEYVFNALKHEGYKTCSSSFGSFIL